jgi:hypothetical protein
MAGAYALPHLGRVQQPSHAEGQQVLCSHGGRVPAAVPGGWAGGARAGLFPHPQVSAGSGVGGADGGVKGAHLPIHACSSLGPLNVHNQTGLTHNAMKRSEGSPTLPSPRIESPRSLRTPPLEPPRALLSVTRGCTRLSLPGTCHSATYLQVREVQLSRHTTGPVCTKGSHLPQSHTPWPRKNTPQHTVTHRSTMSVIGVQRV